MKFEKLADALAVAHEFGLDGVDVAILGAIADKRRSEGSATIMQFSAGIPVASFATIHARVKRMVEKGILAKRVHKSNERYKILDDGPALSRFINKLSDV
jgi:DNA-binding HxlR family transcriptional regulator